MCQTKQYRTKYCDFFYEKKSFLPHVGIDKINVSKLSEIYVGETNILASASDCKLLEVIGKMNLSKHNFLKFNEKI